MKLRSVNFAVALMTGVAIVSLDTAQAQSSQDETGRETAAAEVENDTIIVTARRREESIQDVPLSVVAVGEEALENSNVSSLEDLTNSLPNFQMLSTGVSFRQDLTVRGVNINVRNAGFNSSVSYYVDGVYQGRPANFDQGLFDVERVELLLGPQGTLFGNNTIAGVVNVVTKEPSSTPEGYLQFGAGNFGMREYQFMGNLPLSEQLALRVNVSHQQGDGYTENLFTGETHGSYERSAVRAQLYWDLPRTNVRLVGSHESSDGIPITAEYIEQGTSLPIPVTPPLGNDFTSAPEPFRILQDPSRVSHAMTDFSLHISHRLTDEIDLVSISAYKESNADDLFDQDFAADSRLRSDFVNIENQRIYSQEVRIEAQPTERLQLLGGVYYLNDYVTLKRDIFFIPPFVPLGSRGALGLVVNAFSDVKAESAAAFANAEFEIVDGLLLGLGVRYSTEQQDVIWDQGEIFTSSGLATNVHFPLLGPTGGVLVANAPRYIDSRSDNLWSWTSTLTWHFDEDRMAYLRYARGTKSGGFNLEQLPNPLPSDRSFNSEQLDNYEAGIRTEWFDGSLRFNLTYFFQQYSDLQRADVIPIPISPGVTAFTRVIRNAAAVEIEGGEVSLDFEPLDGLVFSAAYGAADAVFTEYTLLSGANLTGQNLTGVPAWNANLAVSYTTSLPGGFTASAGVSGDLRGSRELGLADAVAVGVEGYEVWNAHLRVGPEDEHWSLNFFVNNLTDELYVTGRGAGTNFHNADLVNFGLPRTYGAVFRLNFGEY